MPRQRDNEGLKLLTYIIAVVASSVCIALLQLQAKTEHFVDVALAGIVLYSVLGFLKTATCNNECMEELHCYSMMVLPYITIPFLATEIWLKHKVSPMEVSYCYTALGTIMALIALICVIDPNLQNFIVFVNAASLTYVGAVYTNYFAIGAGVTFLVFHLICFKCGEVQRESFYNLGLATFSYLTLASVKQ